MNIRDSNRENKQNKIKWYGTNIIIYLSNNDRDSNRGKKQSRKKH